MRGYHWMKIALISSGIWQESIWSLAIDSFFQNLTHFIWNGSNRFCFCNAAPFSPHPLQAHQIKSETDPLMSKAGKGSADRA